MSRILSTLLLVATFLWSSVCFAQCRIVPSQQQITKKKTLPPCHKQQPAEQDCQDKAACFESVPEPELQVAFLPAAPVAIAAVAAPVPAAVHTPVSPSGRSVHSRPLILRI